jgi:Holliday junction resolvase RusA-like endonuclease
MSNSNTPVEFVVYGEPASKANSREFVIIPIKNKPKGRPAFIKSKKARNYEATFSLQCPQIDPIIEADVAVSITIHYATRRPDLDESVILDGMQCKTKKVGKKKIIIRNNVYKNDRQVKEKHIYWALDRKNPRAEIKVWVLDDC